MGFPEIPVYEVQQIAPPHIPSVDDSEGGIISAIKSRGVSILQVDGFSVIEHASIKPHGPDGSTVMWFIEGDVEGNIPRWTDESWWRFALSDAVTRAVEGYIREAQDEDPRTHVYMFRGYRKPEDEVNLDYQHERAMQSQERMHGHRKRSVIHSLRTPTRFLKPDNPRDMKDASLFLNATGEAFVQTFSHLLEGFGKKFIFQQKVGFENSMIVPRTMFGFESFQIALQNTLKLQAIAEKNWLADSIQAASTIPTLTWLPQFAWDNRYAAVPSFSIMYPNDFDRKVGEVDNQYPVWVMPFTQVSAHQVLTDRGMVLEYTQ